MSILTATCVDDDGRINEIPVLVDRYGRPITTPARLGGERQSGSVTGADHQAVAGEWATTAVIAAGTGGPIFAGPCIIKGIWVEVAIGTAAPSLVDGASTRRSLPVGLGIGYHHLGEIIMATNAVCAPGASATGSFRVDYRPLDNRVTWAY